jgi:hypothetical protein
MGLCSSGNLGDCIFFENFPEILGYTRTCAFGGTARFPYTGGDTFQSLHCVCTNVYVWCECGVCELCASKLYPIKKDRLAALRAWAGVVFNSDAAVSMILICPDSDVHAW